MFKQKKTIHNNIMDFTEPPGNVLHPSEGFTVPCIPERVAATGPAGEVEVVDLALVVHYRPWPFEFIESRRFFRFVSRKTPDGKIEWDRQASTPLEADFSALEAEFSSLK